VLPSDLSPLWLSLEIGGIATVCTAVLGTLAARWSLGFPHGQRVVFETFLLCPLILPPTVVGYILMVILGRNGPLQTVFEGGLLFTESASIIAAVVVSLPLMYLSARAAFRSVDRHLLDAARSFGAGGWKTLFTIQIPLATPGLSAGILLSFGRILGEFGATLMVAGNIPGVTQTMPIALYFDVEAANYPRAWMWCGIAFSISGAIIFLINLISDRSGLSRS